MQKTMLLNLGGAVLVAALTGCSSSKETVLVPAPPPPGGSAIGVLDPLQLQQFGRPLALLPVAAPDLDANPGSETYNVTLEQATGYDFGLRKQDGGTLLNPATNAPIATTVWGYTINGLRTGFQAGIIEARSTLAGETGKPVVVNYVNDLRDASGALLTRHLFTVDRTLGGMNAGEPEIHTVTHLHGGHVLPESDGHPLAWITNDPTAKTGLPADPASGRPARPDGNAATYQYPNTQLASHLWFHDHALGITRISVYAGLVGTYLIRDAKEDSLNLPSGAYEIPLVIQDKSFNQDGSQHYSSIPLLDATGEQAVVNGEPVFSSYPEFFGNTMVVNGTVWPYLEVEPRKYRFRLLNASDSRILNLWLETADGAASPGGSVLLIGNEGGLMPVAAAIADNEDNGLLLAPAERADVVIDFSKFAAGAMLNLRNDAPAPFPGGDPAAPNTTGRVMQFRVSLALSAPDTSAVPAAPRAMVLPAGWNAPTTTRVFDLQETDEFDRFTYNPETGTALPRLMLKLNGRNFQDPISSQEQHDQNAVEDWILINSTEDSHPLHIHQVTFQVVEKGTIAAEDYSPATAALLPAVSGAGPQPNVDDSGQAVTADSGSAYTVGPTELGWKDTVRVPPASETRVGYVRVRARFDLLGAYMWHCHILAHEEHEMMRPFMVVSPAAP